VAEDPEAVEFVTAHFAPCIASPLAKSNWRQGVELVKKFLTLRQVGDADEYGTPSEEPWLVVDYACVNTIREFNNYRAAAAPSQRNPREEAKKHDDHAMDALRYALMHLFELGATAHLADVYRPDDYATAARAGVAEPPVSGSTYFTTGVEF
jgi:hypothetical protein